MPGQNVNMRVPDQTLESIDHNATQAGISRTEYILSWLPDTYEPTVGNDETAATEQRSNRR